MSHDSASGRVWVGLRMMSREQFERDDHLAHTAGVAPSDATALNAALLRALTEIMALRAALTDMAQERDALNLRLLCDPVGDTMIPDPAPETAPRTMSAEQWEQIALSHCERADRAEAKNHEDAVALANKINVERDKALIEFGEQCQHLRATLAAMTTERDEARRGRVDITDMGHGPFSIRRISAQSPHPMFHGDRGSPDLWCIDGPGEMAQLFTERLDAVAVCAAFNARAALAGEAP